MPSAAWRSPVRKISRGRFAARCVTCKMTLAKSSPSFKSPHSNTPRDCEPTYGRINKRTVKGTIELIDEAFADQIAIVENGEARRVSVFEAILMQLWFKEISGDKRATAVRLKYQEFVARQNGGGGSEFIIKHAPAPRNDK